MDTETRPVSLSSLPWGDLQSSPQWQEVIVPYLRAEKEKLVSLLANRQLINTEGDLVFMQGQLAMVLQILEAPAFYIAKSASDEAAIAEEQTSGRRYDVRTTRPGRAGSRRD